MGKQRGGQADRLGHRSRHQCPRPRHAHRALALAGADVGADHRDQRRAEAEDQRDLEIFEAHAHAVAGEREGAERPHERGEDDDGQVRQDVVHEAGRADAQDLAEESAAQPHRRQAHEAAARAQVTQEDEAAERVVRHHGEAGAGDAQARQSGEAEDQRGRQRDEDRAAAEGDHGRQHHVAGAADDAGQRVEQPDGDRAGEDDAGVRHRRLQGTVARSHRVVERPPAGQDDGGEHAAEDERDHDRVGHQRVGVGTATGPQRARHRRGDAAAHTARRHRLHQHDERERHRDPGQGVGAEAADEVRLQHVDGDLGQQHDHARCRQPQQGHRDRSLQQAAGRGVGEAPVAHGLLFYSD